jgi:hypothetical protein
VTVQRFSIRLGADEAVGVQRPAARTPAASVIACHGMGAPRDRDKYPRRARESA